MTRLGPSHLHLYRDRPTTLTHEKSLFEKVRYKANSHDVPANHSQCHRDIGDVQGYHIDATFELWTLVQTPLLIYRYSPMG